MGNSDYESGLIVTTLWCFQKSYDWKKLIAYMKLLTNEIAKFFQASYIEMSSLWKSKYILRLAHQLVGFVHFRNVFKKAIFERVIPLVRLFRTKTRKQTFFSTQFRSETLFVLETTWHVELWWWVWFDMNNSLTFSNKLSLKKLFRLYATFNQQNYNFS